MNANNPNRSRHFMFFVLIAVLADERGMCDAHTNAHADSADRHAGATDSNTGSTNGNACTANTNRMPPTATPVPLTRPRDGCPSLRQTGQSDARLWRAIRNASFLFFEERHDSVLGQIEIAAMLNRLYKDTVSTEAHRLGRAYQPKKVR